MFCEGIWLKTQKYLSGKSFHLMKIEQACTYTAEVLLHCIEFQTAEMPTQETYVAYDLIKNINMNCHMCTVNGSYSQKVNLKFNLPLGYSLHVT